jgi:hypothetical protein
LFFFFAAMLNTDVSSDEGAVALAQVLRSQPSLTIVVLKDNILAMLEPAALDWRKHNGALVELFSLARFSSMNELVL